MNFIFFFPDEMSASTVSCYGHPHVKMPNYDQLCEEGVRFDQCIVQNPVCSPSRASLFTGTYPHNSGHRTLWHLLRPHEPSMFRYLKNAGYDIAWYGKNDLYSQEYLDEVCTDIMVKRAYNEKEPSLNYKDVLTWENKYEFGEDGYYSFLYNPSYPEEGSVPVEKEIGQAIDFLKQRGDTDKPFFLYLPIRLPHPPYSILEKFYNMYNPKEVGTELFPETKGKPSYEKFIRKYRSLDELPDEVFEKVNAVYLGMNSYVDYLLGLLNKTLEETGHAKDTTLIVSSDHGDWHGKRRLVEKWPNAMDDDMVHVPLIIRTPGNKHGHVVKEQVELFDIMPTILDLANIQCEHTHFAHSLVPQLHGDVGDDKRIVFCEGGYDLHEPHCSEGYAERVAEYNNPENIYYPKCRQQAERPETVCRTVMARSNEYKLILRTSGENEFYDLKSDSDECVNRYDDSAFQQQIEMLKNEILMWYIKTSDTVPVNDDIRHFGSC